MRLLLEEILRRVEVLEVLTDDPPYKPNLVVRGLSALPVRFGA
jgi:cytochrome P450